MIHKLTQEQSDAIKSGGSTPLEVVDPVSNRTFYVVAAEVHRQAMEALRRERDRDAIAEGLAQLQAGEGIPLDEARKLSREKLLNRRP